MKGLNDYIKELNSPSTSLQRTTELLSKAGYSIDKVLQDLKQYNTELTEVTEVSTKRASGFKDSADLTNAYYNK